jgi:phosphatidylinositol alpha-1,6-mannosyltransferase
MKTLLLTLEYPPFNGGVANYYANLVKYWPQAEQLEVINNNQGSLFQDGAFSWYQVIGKIWHWRKMMTFDYLLIGQILPLGTAAYFASLIKPFKYAVVLHGLDFSSSLACPRKRWLTRLILNKADKIICANSRVAQMVIDFNQRLTDKVKIVNPGIEPLVSLASQEKVQNLKQHYRLENTFTLLTVGRLALRKGVDSVIKALADPALKDLKIKYFIAGIGDQEKYLRELASQSPCKEKIIFLGELTEIEKWNWLYACDAFIMPAREIGPDFEGFGIVYLEANLAGKPVIAGDSGGVKDAVQNLESGLLVNPEKIAEISQAILRLANDKKLVSELGEKGKRRAQAKFNWEKQAQILCELIK